MDTSMDSLPHLEHETEAPLSSLITGPSHLWPSLSMHWGPQVKAVNCDSSGFGSLTAHLHPTAAQAASSRRVMA